MPDHGPHQSPDYLAATDDSTTHRSPPSGPTSTVTTAVATTREPSPVMPDDDEVVGSRDDSLGAGQSPSSKSSPTGASNQLTTDQTKVTQESEKQRSHSVSPNLHREASAARSVLQRSVSRLRGRHPRDDRHFKHQLELDATGADCIVDFDGLEDPYRAINWDPRKKWVAVALFGITTGTVTFDSSVFSAALQPIEADFGVSTYVATLGLTMMLLGFGLGPLIWAPLSEIYGRKPAVLIPFFISMCFTFATGVSKDIQSILITRFFSGFFGSAPITNTGGVLGDLFAPAQRGQALVLYAMAVVGGPTLGPLVGSALVEGGLSWRWTEYLTGIMKAAILLADVTLLDESYSPVLLKYKARKLRTTTGNWALHAQHEEWDITFSELAVKYLVRPFQLLATPICFLVALYASFVYGLLYSLLESIPIAFQDLRGWSPVLGSLPFVAVLVGIIVAAGINMANQVYYIRRLEDNAGKAVPEARLPPMMIGSVCLSAGLWIFAWTPAPVHPSAQIIACALFGCGFFAIFQAALNYLIDTFQTWGASAIAANTFLRSIFAASFPLFIRPEIEALGFQWGVSLFAFVSVGMIPIPYLFFIFGPKIRARGKWSVASTM